MIQTIKHKKYYLGNSINPNQTNGELAEATIPYYYVHGNERKKSANFRSAIPLWLKEFFNSIGISANV
jgi:hypothetical protein